MLFDNRRNKAKHIDKMQEEHPYEAPLNVRQIANLPYGEGGALSADYYEPMALTRADTKPDKSAMRVAILLHDDPYAGSKDDVMPLSMELARRGMAVFALRLSVAENKGDPFFCRQLEDVVGMLSSLREDPYKLRIHPETYGATGNKVILMGVGTGAILADLVVRLHYNARIREYFAARCPVVRDYFGIADTPTVDFAPLVRIAALVSMSGALCPTESVDHRLDEWLGRGWESSILGTYLHGGRWSDAAWPPMLFITSGADTLRGQTLAVDAALPTEVRRRVLDYPREDAEGHVLENQFWVRYPLWEQSKEVNSQIVAFCKGV